MSAEAVKTMQQLAFLPWLRLKTTYRIAGVEFMPWRGDASDAISPVLADAPLNTILSS